MTLHLRSPGVGLVALFLVGIGSPAEAQERYYPRYYEEAPRYERIYRDRRADDRYFEERLRYYSRENVARRQAERARRIPRGAERAAPRRRDGVGVPFLDRLFGAPDRDERQERWTARRDPGAVEIRRAPTRVRRRAPVETAARPPQPTPAPVLADKPAVAATTLVAVFGDSIGDGLAGGLEQAFADAPELAVRKHFKANAGLVRDDYFDIVAEARKALAAGPITYAVVDVGVNDRQPFLAQRDAAPLSPAWRQRYVARIDALLAAFKDKNVPVFWVGLAPSASASATADHIALNALAKERVEAAGGTYVDVWEGFVDEAGDYMETGPRLDGQTARLRLDDGVHFSSVGARKLAHYVEREIRKVFEPIAATPETLLSALTPPAADPAAAEADAPFAADRPKPLAGPLVVLTSPRRAEGGALAAAPAPGPRGSAAEAERLLVKGEALDADPGRMDDHRWPGAAGPP